MQPSGPSGQLIAIHGPIYVEQSSLHPSHGQHGQHGHAVLGPPVVSQPFIGSPAAPQFSNDAQFLFDEQSDEVKLTPSRRFNSNVQSGIQQIGHGNMNLQGNIQQVGSQVKAKV